MNSRLMKRLATVNYSNPLCLWLLALTLAFLSSMVFAGRRTATVKTGGKTVRVRATEDSGATDGWENDPNNPSHPTEVDRKTAKKLGLIDANGVPDPNKFEKDPNDPNKIKTETYHLADCTRKPYGVTKPITISVTDDANNTIDVNIPVTVDIDPNDPCATGSNLLGEDWMRAVKITIKYLPRRITTFNNKETNVPASPNAPPASKPPISDGQPRRSFPGRFDDTPVGPEGDCFIGLGSPYTILAMNTALAAGLTLEDTIDLNDEPLTLNYLYKAGFIPKEEYGIFYITNLPTLQLFVEGGTVIYYENVEVLVPYGPCAEEPPMGALIGSDLLEGKTGYMTHPLLGDREVGQITYLGLYEDTYFTPASPVGDLDGDLDVDFRDVALVAASWLSYTGFDFEGICLDMDGDGYGNPANALCTYPELDCDDMNPEIHPYAPEVYDGLDNDCDGLIDEDCCIPEGGEGPVVPGGPECCPGLVELAKYFIEDGMCIPMVGVFVCTSCGDGICGPGEDVCNCPEDCVPVCGNGLCEPGEDSINCPEDCMSVCGNGLCEPGEDSINCPEDCPPICGNGLCEPGEDSINCPEDCPPVCGNGLCEPGEDSINCPEDCPPICGNGLCEPGEDSITCPEDCPPVCGNGLCEPGEDSINCPEDCGPD